MTIDEMQLQALQTMYDIEVTNLMNTVDKVNDLKFRIMEVEKRMKMGV